jgi:hypothetical protein
MYGIDLAVSISDGPELSEHRRRELALARLMAEAIAIMLYTGDADADIRIETAKDMIREIKHTFPELRDEWNEI